MPDAGKTKRPSAEPLSDHRLRVFISYSHGDEDLVRVLAEVIEENGMAAVFDQKGMKFGKDFPQQIIHFISHAHIFMPLLTETSVKRPWAQQEIGYALALRVPTVPVAIDCEPGEFLHGIQAIHLKTMDYAALKKLLTLKALEPCLHESPAGGALYECADTTEERAILFARYARAVTHMGNSGIVRQSGGLSFLQIPDEPLDHPLWRLRYGNKSKPKHHCKVIWEERQALTEHAKADGCRIIIDPRLDFSFYGGDARRSRLECLLRVLRGKDIQSCHVAIAALPLNESITIVGDWFAAHSITNIPGDGYRQTIFTRHAPTIAEMIKDFDRRFAEALGSLPVAHSRKRAIAEIERRIADLPPIQATAASGKG